MKILMFSLDRALLGEQTGSGDSIKRHQIYGESCDELNIVVPSKKGYHKQQISDNVFVWPTNSKSEIFFIPDAIKMGKKIHKDNLFNLVVCQDVNALIGWYLKKKLKVKLLINIHGDLLQNKKNKKWIFDKWFNILLLCALKLAIKEADGIRVVSSGIKNKLVKKGIKKNKIYVIPTPIDLKKFLTFDQARVYELRQKYPGKNILFVGRLEKEKNLDWFLGVFKQIKNKYNQVLFLIIGQGSELNSLKLKTRNLKLENSVVFVGRVDHDDLTNYYHSADVLVLPSTSESFGKVLVEAGAAGVPCVASSTTGAKEIIQDKKTGFLVPINNQKKMAEKILDLLEDEKKAKFIGQQAQVWIKENFNGDVNIKKIIKFWQRLVFGV